MSRDIDLQISAFTRYSSLSFSPDWLGDLLFNGIAQQATRSDAAYGVQADGSWRINDQHTLRFGFLVQQEIAGANTLSQVLPVDAPARRPPTCRIDIGNSFTKTGGLYGVYVQDEWRILPTVTINGGLRFDGVDEFTHENQVSPRLNVVWKPTPRRPRCMSAMRAISCRRRSSWFQPGTITQFAGTTAAPEVTQNDPVKAERSQLLRCRRQPDRDAGPDRRRRRLLQDLQQPDRRGPVRRADHPDRVQLCAWPAGGRGVHRQL